MPKKTNQLCALAGVLLLALGALLFDHAASRDRAGPGDDVVRGVGKALVPDAEAQSSIDEWVGKTQQELSFHGSLSSEALVFSAVTGKALVVKAITMSTSVTGTLNLYDGSGSTIVDQFDLIASHDPITIDQKRLGKGIVLSKGNALYAQMTGGTAVTISARVEQD